MAFTLSNKFLHFTLDPASSSWSLFTQTAEAPAIENARFNGVFRGGDFNIIRHFGRLWPWVWQGLLKESQIDERARPSAHGNLQTLVVRAASNPHPLAITLEFALPQDHPFLMMQMTVRNVGSRNVNALRLNPFCVGEKFGGGAVRLSARAEPATFFSNGWQSWSFAGALTAAHQQPHTRLGLFQGATNHNPATPVYRRRGHFSGDMFGVLAQPGARAAIVAGFLAQREQFGSIEATVDSAALSLRLRAHGDGVLLPPNAELTTDPLFVQLLTDYDDDPLATYALAVARQNNARAPDHTPVGWCSWYHYFDRVTEDDVRNNLRLVSDGRARLPLTLFQLDDGFEAEVGDWFATNAKFPSGLRALSESIRGESLTPGLWLAPFIARPNSMLARQQPDWFLRNAFGLPASAGFVFNAFSRGLDVTHPAAQDHIRALISTAVSEWGYPYLKLDFLYAAALPGKRFDPTRTRAQALTLGLKLIREAAGEETFLLGCGCPLGTAVGLVDGMRISADVDIRWLPSFNGVSRPFAPEMAMPSARNAIRNSITRAPLHRRWWLNDPDCLLARESSELTLDEVQALASVIALSGGMFLVSDDMATLSPARRGIVEALLPVVGKTALADDWLESPMPEVHRLKLRNQTGDWQVLGVFNWGDQPARRTTHLDSDSHIVDFWNQTYARSRSGEYVLDRVPAHGGRLLAIRRVTAGAQFIGSSLHFSQGFEVNGLTLEPNHAQVELKLDRAAQGKVIFSLPRLPRQPAHELADGIYQFDVSVNGTAVIHIDW